MFASALQKGLRDRNSQTCTLSQNGYSGSCRKPAASRHFAFSLRSFGEEAVPFAFTATAPLFAANVF